MKKIAAILLFALIMSLVLIGCGGGEDQATKDTGSPATEGTVKLEDGSKVNYGTAKPGTSLSLPDAFPKDIVPLLDDAEINFVNTNDANKAIGVTFSTDKSLDEAIAFYQKVMADGKVNVENKGEGTYFIVGSKDSYAVTISMTYKPGEKMNVLLDVTPSQ